MASLKGEDKYFSIRDVAFLKGENLVSIRDVASLKGENLVVFQYKRCGLS